MPLGLSAGITIVKKYNVPVPVVEISVHWEMRLGVRSDGLKRDQDRGEARPG
jgi:hypothetical protein